MIRWCGNSRIQMDKRKRHLDAFAIANPSDRCHNQSIWSLILLQIHLISKCYCLSIQFDWKKQISDSRNLSHFNKILENSCNKIFFYNLGLILVAQNDTPNVLTKQRTLANRNREKPIDWKKDWIGRHKSYDRDILSLLPVSCSSFETFAQIRW